MRQFRSVVSVHDIVSKVVIARRTPSFLAKQRKIEAWKDVISSDILHAWKMGATLKA